MSMSNDLNQNRYSLIMMLYINLVTWNFLLSCSVLQIQSNQATGEAMGLLLEYSSYPKHGDIPVLNRKIFKGYRVSIQEHPYVVSIRRQFSHYLTGVILTANLVITVAHPLADVPTMDLGVVFGEHFADRGVSMATVLLVIVHQNFNPYTLTADIAMLRLYENINLGFLAKSIQLIPLGSKLAGTKAFVTGWGRCDCMGSELCLFRSSKFFPDERFDPMLRSISFTMSPSNFCLGYNLNDLTLYYGMLCTGPAREEDPVCPCMGVPGAPLVVKAHLVGLLSWGFGCGYGHDLPLVYTSIQSYSSWILTNIEKLHKIKNSNLTQIYHATKAYLIAEWLRQVRLIPPTLNIKQDKSMEPLALDNELIKVLGVIYDVRDFIDGGIYHEEKQNMYATLINIEKNREKLKLIKENLNTVPLVAFLSNETLEEDMSDTANNITEHTLSLKEQPEESEEDYDNDDTN